MKEIILNDSKKKRLYFCLSGIMLLVVGIFAFVNANAQSLWVDELSTIGFVRTGLSLRQTIHYFLSTENNLPLYSLFIYFWYRLIPYGEQFILLPSILFSLVSFIYIARTVHKITLRDSSAFIAICVCCGYSSIYYQVFWEARCYALAIMLSAMALCYFISLQIDYSIRHLVLFGITQLLLLWTHWYSVIPVGFFGLFSLILIIRKKIKWTCIIPFLFDAITFIPWLVHSLLIQGKDTASFWYGIPTYKDVIWVILGLCNSRYLYAIGFGFAIVAVVLEYNKYGQILYCAVTVILGVLTMYVYSAFINPSHSLFYSKYFLVLFPMVVTMITVGYYDLISHILSRLSSIIVKSCINAFLYIIVLCYVGWGIRDGYVSIHSVNEDFRQLAIDLVSEEYFYSEDSCLIASNRFCALDGFVDYYFDKQGLLSPTNIVNATNRYPEENLYYPSYADIGEKLLLKYKTIYAIVLHNPIDGELLNILEDNFYLSEGKSRDYLIFCRQY